MIKYADDTVVYFADKNVDVIEKVLNLEMEYIGKACKENELLLNLKKGKTEAMLFRTSKRLKLQGRELKITYNGTPILFVTEYVDLGNVIDNTLTLNTNFSQAYKQVSNWLRLLKRVREYLNVDVATKIFSMIIPPILRYKGPVKWSYT